jgi:pyruvate,water dikinase
MKNVYWFNEISKSDVGIAGGKGANLGEMFQSGFPVPNGFIVGSNSYFDFIKSTGVDKVIKKSLENLSVEDELALNKASEIIKDAIVGTSVSNDLRVDIVKAYNKLCGVDLIPSSSEEILVAVRSSATAEDLPEASFAGQQATFVNIKGADSLVEAVRKCWASLFEARAIYYRKLNNFDDLKVGIAVVVQKMVESEKSGVMFSVNPVTGENAIMIEAGFGLGEAVVSGAINPDRYIVDKNSLNILKVNVARQEVMLVKGRLKDEWVEVPEELQEKQKLSNSEISELAGWGLKIENHYNFPQDMEWAIEGGKIFIVQSRAITTLKKTGGAEKKQSGVENDMKVEQKENILIQGFGASPGVGSGLVRVILDVKDLYKLKNGEVLVTRMTTPDFVPAMKRAIAIVTDEGGITCHAAIVSRELGVPCIVGTEKATIILKDEELVTVDAVSGRVFEGKVERQGPAKSEVQAGVERLVTGTKIYVNLAEPESADKIASQNVDGVGLLRAEFMIAGFGKHPKKLLKEGKGEEFVDMLVKGLRKFCAAFNPRPIIYRATDFKTNEYRNLEGGAEFEPQEDNPMIGFRGCFRYVKDPEVFNLELEAVKRVREQGFKNLWLMIPVVRTVHEFKIVKGLVEKSGLFQSHDFKLGIMCEVPSTVILAEEFCKAGTDFFSIGSNDLTQLTLGVDRDNPIVADDFDERDESVLRSIEHVIKTCHRFNVKVGICGQAPSEYREFAEKLVEFGIDSISVNPDVIDATRQVVASAEFKVLLDSARK